MPFLIDADLPRDLVGLFAAAGHSAIRSTIADLKGKLVIVEFGRIRVRT